MFRKKLPVQPKEDVEAIKQEIDDEEPEQLEEPEEDALEEPKEDTQEKTSEKKEITTDDIVGAIAFLEERIKNIEAVLFRLKSIV